MGNADLALPDYLSKIVNVGIQQGIKDAFPQALRSEQFEKISLLSSEEQAV